MKVEQGDAASLGIVARRAQAEVVATAPAPTPLARAGHQTFRSLRHRDFRVLFYSILGVSCGQWMEQIAISWMVLQLTDSYVMVAVANGARALPSLVLSPIGGVIADRFNRRNVIAISQGCAACVAATMATLSLLDVIKVWHILVLVVCFGTFWAINNPARHAMIPQLVPREDLPNAIALNSTGFNISRALGPAVGSAMLYAVGFGTTFAITTCIYVVVLVNTLQIRSGNPPQDVVWQSFGDNLREGLRYLRRDRNLTMLVVLALVPVAIGLPYMTLMPIFARDVLHRGEVGYGMLLMCIGIGSLAGTVFLANADVSKRGGFILLGLGLVFGLSLATFAISKNYVLSLVVLLPVGASSMMYLSLNNTLIQLLADDAMRGRVMSLLMMQFGLTPAGAVLAGVYAEAVSPMAAVLTMGLLLATFSVGAMLLLPNMRNLDTTRARKEATTETGPRDPIGAAANSPTTR